MIDPKELRWGNTILQKSTGRILPVRYESALALLVAQGALADLYPVVLKAEVLERTGFTENKKYALLPQAREFRLVLAVKGKAHHELLGYVKSNGECLAWYSVDGLTASNPVQHLHQLQNLHFALTGMELEYKTK